MSLLNRVQPPRRPTRRVYVSGQNPRDFPQPTDATSAYSASQASKAGASISAPQVDPAQLKRMHANVGREISDVLSRNRGIAESANRIKSSELELVRDHARDAHDQARHLQQDRQKEVAEYFSNLSESINKELGATTGSLAPGVLGSSVRHIAEQKISYIYSPYIRVGEMDVVGTHFPALLPFSSEMNWLLEGSAKQTRELILATLVRISATVPLKHLRILIFDPRLTGSMGVLSPLRGINGETFPQAMSVSSDFAESLSDSIRLSSSNAENMGQRGAHSLNDMWNQTSLPQGTQSVAVVLDYPYGVDSSLRKMLQRAADIGPKSGLNLIIQKDPAIALGENELRFPQDTLASLRYEDGFWNIGSLTNDRVKIRHDGEASPQAISSVLDAIEQNAKSVSGPSWPLHEIIHESLSTPWSESSAESLDALIGKVGDRPLTVSLRTENPPTPNMLVGGAVGQGKSNLLLSIIYSLATRYSPDELEFLLLDFKRGLEFKRFDKDENGVGWLPHVKALSLESNQEFGVAVLRHVSDMLHERSELMKKSGASSVNELRSLGISMPRVVLVIDEFHVLFDGDDDLTEEAVRLLELLAKQGRAYGLHLLLASQTVSGISGLRSKADSIFAQFPLRMSLKNTAAESQAILSQGNTAAANLTYRGEVIFNKNFGQDPEGSNALGVIAYVEGERFAHVQRQLWDKHHAEPPMVFIGSDYAYWNEQHLNAMSRRNDGIVEMWIGRPIAITQEPFIIQLDEDVNQTVALIGSGDEEAYAVLSSAIYSSLRSIGSPCELVILNGFNTLSNQMSAVADRTQMDGCKVTVVERREIPTYLVEKMAPRLEQETDAFPTMVIGLGLQRVPGMDKKVVSTAANEDDWGISFSTEETLDTGNSVLLALSRRGALQRMYFIGWWRSLESMKPIFGHSQEEVATYLILKAGRDDVTSIAGPLARASQEHPRVSVFDTTSDEGMVTVVPFGPIQAGEMK